MQQDVQECMAVLFEHLGMQVRPPHACVSEWRSLRRCVWCVVVVRGACRRRARQSRRTSAGGAFSAAARWRGRAGVCNGVAPRSVEQRIQCGACGCVGAATAVGAPLARCVHRATARLAVAAQVLIKARGGAASTVSPYPGRR